MTDNVEKMKMFELHCNEICRLCLIRGKDMSPIFSRPSDEKSISIPFRIMAFTSIKLETGDGLPGLICSSCLLNVEQVYNFKRQCEQADVLLREYFSQTNLLDNGKVNELNLERKDDRLDVEDVMRGSDMSHSENEEDEMERRERRIPGAKKRDVLNGGYQSESCSSGSASAVSLPVTVNALRCPTCNKPFTILQRFEKHVKIHNQDGSSSYPCEYCEVEFSDRKSLRWHWREHAGVGELTCMTCGETAVTRQAYDQHVAIHDAVKPHHCQLCDRGFSSRSDLRKHVVIHTGMRPYTCATCGKSFTRSTNLNKHARAHIGDRPFDCSECNKKFSTRGDLARHAVTHTGVKPHACTICGLAFSRRDKLNRHVKLHDKVRPFLCTVCMLSFNNRKALTAHIGIHHSGQAQTQPPASPTEQQG